MTTARNKREVALLEQLKLTREIRRQHAEGRLVQSQRAEQTCQQAADLSAHRDSFEQQETLRQQRQLLTGFLSGERIGLSLVMNEKFRALVESEAKGELVASNARLEKAQAVVGERKAQVQTSLRNLEKGHASLQLRKARLRKSAFMLLEDEDDDAYQNFSSAS